MGSTLADVQQNRVSDVNIQYTHTYTHLQKWKTKAECGCRFAVQLRTQRSEVHLLLSNITKLYNSYTVFCACIKKVSLSFLLFHFSLRSNYNGKVFVPNMTFLIFFQPLLRAVKTDSDLVKMKSKSLYCCQQVFLLDCNMQLYQIIVCCLHSHWQSLYYVLSRDIVYHLVSIPAFSEILMIQNVSL